VNLLKKLKEIEGDFEMCLCDWRKNIHNMDGGGEPNGIGIESKFEIRLEEDESFNKKFIGIDFTNDDYNEDGTPNAGSSIFCSVERMLDK